MNNLNYEKFELMSYMNSPLFNNNNRTLLLALRTRTVRGIRNDFRGLYNDNMCPLQCGDVDTIENVLTCRVIKQHHTSNELTKTTSQYQDIFSHDIDKQQKVTELYSQLLKQHYSEHASCWKHWSRAWRQGRAKSSYIMLI